MSVVIVGGHDRMVCRYKKICKEHNCKAKVFTQMSARLSEQIGSPDLLILFTNTVSHKMVKCAITEAEKCNADIVRCHTSSGTALNEILIINLCLVVKSNPIDCNASFVPHKYSSVKLNSVGVFPVPLYPYYNTTGGIASG